MKIERINVEFWTKAGFNVVATKAATAEKPSNIKINAGIHSPNVDCKYEAKIPTPMVTCPSYLTGTKNNNAPNSDGMINFHVADDEIAVSLFSPL